MNAEYATLITSEAKLRVFSLPQQPDAPSSLRLIRLKPLSLLFETDDPFWYNALSGKVWPWATGQRRTFSLPCLKGSEQIAALWTACEHSRMLRLVPAAGLATFEVQPQAPTQPQRHVTLIDEAGQTLELSAQADDLLVYLRPGTGPARALRLSYEALLTLWSAWRGGYDHQPLICGTWTLGVAGHTFHFHHLSEQDFACPLPYTASRDARLRDLLCTPTGDPDA